MKFSFLKIFIVLPVDLISSGPHFGPLAESPCRITCFRLELGRHKLRFSSLGLLFLLSLIAISFTGNIPACC